MIGDVSEVEISVKDVLDSYKRQISEKAEEIATRDGIIAKLTRELDEKNRFIDQIGANGGRDQEPTPSPEG